MMTTARIRRGCGHEEFVKLYGSLTTQKAELQALKAAPCPECGHVDAAKAAPAPMPAATPWGPLAPERTGVRTNRRPGRCVCCNQLLAPGMGRLWQDETDEWVVACLDQGRCARIMEGRQREMDQIARRVAAHPARDYR